MSAFQTLRKLARQRVIQYRSRCENGFTSIVRLTWHGCRTAERNRHGPGDIEAASIDVEIGRLSVGEGHPGRGNRLPNQSCVTEEIGEAGIQNNRSKPNLGAVFC